MLVYVFVASVVVFMGALTGLMTVNMLAPNVRYRRKQIKRRRDIMTFFGGVMVAMVAVWSVIASFAYSATILTL